MRDGSRPSAATSGARVGAGRGGRVLAARARFSAVLAGWLLLGSRCGGGPHPDTADALPCACSNEVCIGGACVSAAPRDCACTGWQVCTASGACVAPPRTAEYEIGACYHDTGTWALDASGAIVVDSMQVFIPRYHLPGVRAKVRSQLASMAAKNVDVVKTMLWYGDDPAEAPGAMPYAVGFPPTAQQLQNLHDYLADVSTTLRPDGQPMQLYLSAGWLGAADFGIGDPKKGKLGWWCRPTTDYEQRMRQTMTSVLDVVSKVFRADGRPAVTLAYFFSEVMVCATDDDADPMCAGLGQRCGDLLCDPCDVTPSATTAAHNQQWLLATFYPSFVQQARAAGSIPTVYFNGGTFEGAVLALNGWIDPYASIEPAFAAVTGHLSTVWVFHSLWWWRAHGLPLPDRLEVDYNPATFSTGDNTPNHAPPNYTTPATILHRTFDDLEVLASAFYPGRSLRYGIPETAYYRDPIRRAQIGKAFALEHLQRGTNPEFVTFWAGLPQPEEQTTDSPEDLDFSAFTAGGIVFPFTSALSNLGFETSSDGVLPDEWHTLVPATAPSNAAWLDGAAYPDVFDGASDLRFNSDRCASGCASVESDPVAVAPPQVLVFSLEQKNGYRFDDTNGPNPAPSSPAYSGMLISVLDDSDAPLLRFGTMNNSADGSIGANPPAWSRYVGVVPITAPGTVRLRVGLQNVPAGTVMDVDALR